MRITRLVAGGLIAAALCSSTSTTASTSETFNETFSPSWLADFLNDPRTDKLNSFAVHPDTYAPMFLDGLALLNEFPAPNAPEPCTGYSAQEAIVTTDQPGCPSYSEFVVSEFGRLEDLSMTSPDGVSVPVSKFVFRSENTVAVDGGEPVIRSASNAVTTHSWRIWEGKVELIMDISAGEQPVAAKCPTLLVGDARFEAEVVPDEVSAGERIADLNVWNNTGLRKSNAAEEGAVQAHVECFAGTGGTVTAEFTVEMWVAFAA